MSGRELHWKFGDREAVVRIEESSGQGVLHLDGQAIHFSVSEHDAQGGRFETAGTNHRFYVHRDKNEFTIWLDGRTYRLQRVEKGRTADAAGGLDSGEIRALMPGKILRVDVAVGDSVVERQSVIIMESMKMETALHAPRAGTVAEVRCRAGQVVEMGELLLTVE